MFSIHIYVIFIFCVDFPHISFQFTNICKLQQGFPCLLLTTFYFNPHICKLQLSVMKLWEPETAFSIHTYIHRFQFGLFGSVFLPLSFQSIHICRLLYKLQSQGNAAQWPNKNFNPYICENCNFISNWKYPISRNISIHIYR